MLFRTLQSWKFWSLTAVASLVLVACWLYMRPPMTYAAVKRGMTEAEVEELLGKPHYDYPYDYGCNYAAYAVLGGLPNPDPKVAEEEYDTAFPPRFKEWHKNLSTSYKVGFNRNGRVVRTEWTKPTRTPRLFDYVRDFLDPWFASLRP